MSNISEQLIKDLIDQGVDTYFGVQGGACARLIENVIKFKGNFIPVLNEQSAGYYAHGYHLATNKVAGLIFTTGPGLTNGVSGIAACYYDRVPLVTLVGQVNSKIHIAKSTNTRMVGFQEVPHLEVCKPISDFCLKIESEKKYFNLRKKFLSSLNTKVQVVEILDDVQRKILEKKPVKIKKFKKNKLNRNISPRKSYQNLIKKSKKPVIIIGAGFARDKENLSILRKIIVTNIPIAITWGGQKIQKYIYKSSNYLGIMGTHNPGTANEYINKSDLVIALGCSLLQHQIGKKHDDFAPKSKIMFVNDDLNETKRAKLQFGNRLLPIHLDANKFAKYYLLKFKKKIKTNFIEKNTKSNPVNFLKSIFEKISKNSLIFSDAGATLSWTYQAANCLKNCPPIFTAFNLHSMGYANCASVGAAIANKKNIYCIIGDGSIPMNSQELTWLKKYSVKIIILDNRGYGIIRQTQREFYKSKFYGSDFINKKTSLPSFSLEKLLSSYEIENRRIKKTINKKNLKWILSSQNTKALIYDVKYSDEVIF